MELVSIVVPVHNSEKFIAQTIASVQNQTYQNWELLLINDFSNDGSENIINLYKKNDKRIQLINLENNVGAAMTRNKGIELAKGRYIAFLDSDDVWEKEKLEKQLDFIKKNNYAFTFTGYQFVDENLCRNGKIVNVPKKLTYREALKNTTIFTSTVIIDAKIVGKKLIRMPDVGSEDAATWWQILKNGFTAYGLNEILSFYRRSKGTLTSNKFQAIKRTWNLYRNVENLNIFYSIYNFTFYVINAIRRRI